MAGIKLLCDRPEVDARRLGCAGLSGGCWLSQVVTVLDHRIRAVILRGFFTTFAQTIWHGHCICHHPHGIGAICDMPDISALIAPRPQFIESGIDDTNYPHQPAFSLTQIAYELLSATDRLGLDRYDGGHLFRGAKNPSRGSSITCEADMTNAPIWHDLHILTIEGQDYTDTLSPYDRLPARAARQNPRTCPAPEPIQRPPLRALPDRHPHPPHALNSTQRILWLWSTYPPLASAALISKLAPTTPGAGWQKPVLIASLPAQSN